jgi:hypothetical protein
MVWHSYQLNPRDFLEDCLRYGKLKFWRTGLPWAAINDCLDDKSFHFIASTEAVKRYEEQTGHAWNSLNDPSKASVQCPHCSEVYDVPWTTWDSKSAWLKCGSGNKLDGEDIEGGFADDKFKFETPCAFTINHNLLKTSKFRKDMIALRYCDFPMPGTILSLNGM